jgi:hypothetical protein
MNIHKNTTLVRIQRTRLTELQNKAKQIGIPASVLLDVLLVKSFSERINIKEVYENK